MKHGYEVLGRCEWIGDVSYGSFRTLAEARRTYEFVKSSVNTSDLERRHLRLVELVERVIESEPVA